MVQPHSQFDAIADSPAAGARKSVDDRTAVVTSVERATAQRTAVAASKPPVLVLSHLFPNAAHPATGPFVADEVAALSDRFEMTVVSPVRWVPPLPVATWRAERRLPLRDQAATPVWFPRVPSLPFGGMAREAHLWLRVLRPRIRRLVESTGARLLHAHFAIPDGFVATTVAAELNIPCVVTLWGSDAMLFPDRPGLGPLFRRVVSTAARVIAVSEPIARRAVAFGADPERVRTIRGGVRLADPDATPARDLYSPGQRVVLWVGGLQPVKRPTLIVDAFAPLATQHPELRLVIAGAGPLAPAVRARAVAHGIGDRVLMLGHLDKPQLTWWMQTAAVLANSSESEGTPLAVCEALVSGTPVAAVSVGGIPDVVREVDGGTLAVSNDARGLADAIEHELRVARDRRALARRSQRLRIEHTSAAIADLYNEVLHE
jgi:glycosyltransferase involved in cell wall biosynthesis